MYPGCVIERDEALYFFKNEFCLILNLEGVSPIKVIEEIKRYCEIVTNYKTFRKTESFSNIKIIFKKVFQLTIFINHDSKTFHTNTAVPYCVSLYD